MMAADTTRPISLSDEQRADQFVDAYVTRGLISAADSGFWLLEPSARRMWSVTSSVTFENAMDAKRYFKSAHGSLVNRVLPFQYDYTAYESEWERHSRKYNQEVINGCNYLHLDIMIGNQINTLRIPHI